ncbi:inositol-tetrakisphosphate 1-kinase [Anaeramoeba flamelloides]|uniref:Inositol-tetrakisphosphate 1-kinase n=1 Tax=Anaeramoeba flamelloides TaxID=1746091 RepID=A0ABQ8YFE5_9EUKA|nr:inositol-tetrakisphosphate 1-kinase [Anaeramoeba flamelloides]
MLNIGYCLSQRKQKRLRWPKFIKYCKENHSIILHELDITQPIKLEVQLDGILQKVADELFNEDQLYQKRLSNFLNFVRENPETVVIEDIEKLNVFRSRDDLNETIKPKVEEIENAFLPPSIVASSCSEAEELISTYETVSYPVICKPVSAGGLSKTHEIYIIGNNKGLKSLDNFPYLITPYYNHSQTIYKIFINGDSYVSVPRYSLRNLDPNELSGFKTAKLGKGIQIPENIKPNKTIQLLDNLKGIELKVICEKVKTALGVEILGVDVIRCDKDQRLAIVDINYFPGFRGVQSFYEDLAILLKARIQTKKQSNTLIEK